MKNILRRSFANFDPSKLQIKQNKLLIDGKWVNSVKGETFASVNPYTEKEIARVQKASAEDVNIAVKAARRAFDEGPWPRMEANERSKIMFRIAELIEKNKEELAALESLDNGKPYKDAFNIDLTLAANVMRYYAGWADKIHGKTIPVMGPHFCYTREEPVGVAGMIYAWNFPLALATWKLGPCLATGSVGILKPPEQTPLTALRLGELLLEAGLPEGVINILTGYGDVGSALVKHAGVDKIAFTGSSEVGREILSQNGYPNIKRMTMELGGKSPNIILEDADVDMAIQQAHVGVFFNQGQCCVAGSRVFVHEKIYDEFVEKCSKYVNQAVLGDPFHEKTTQGPQVDKNQKQTIDKYIEKGKQEGAKLITGKDKYSGSGYFVPPTVFVDVEDHMTIAKEEIFGPVMPILKWSNLDEVIKRANSSVYGLGAGVVGKDMSTILKLAKHLRAGHVYVNCYDQFQQTTPFGGFKDSGLGRELGEAALRSYLETKTVIIKDDK